MDGSQGQGILRIVKKIGFQKEKTSKEQHLDVLKETQICCIVMLFGHKLFSLDQAGAGGDNDWRTY